MRVRWLATTSSRESPERARIFFTFGGERSGRRREPRELRVALLISRFASISIPTQFSSEHESKYKHVSSRLSRYARGFYEDRGPVTREPPPPYPTRQLRTTVIP